MVCNDFFSPFLLLKGKFSAKKNYIEKQLYIMLHLILYDVNSNVILLRAFYKHRCNEFLLHF